MNILRRQIAIVFLVLIMLQIGGYYAVMEYFKLQVSEKTARRIANGQASIGGHLVLKIPVNSNLPANHFIYDGKVYQVIEQHTYQDILYVVCIRDDGATDAQETIESFAQSLAGKNNNDQSAGVRFFENITKYFCAEQPSWYTGTDGWMSTLQFGSIESLYSFNHQSLLFHPPAVVT